MTEKFSGPRCVSTPPTFELRGAAFRNKGAELMLRTVIYELAQRFPGSQLAMNHLAGSSAQRRAIGALEVVWNPPTNGRLFRRLRNATAIAVKSSLPVGDRAAAVAAMIGGPMGSTLAWQRGRRAGTIVPSEVDIVLDLSGYAYGDQWGSLGTAKAAAYFEQVKRSGGVVVLFPQQLGPFEDAEARAAFERLSRFADLIYARDRISYTAAVSVVADPARLRQAPDFTVGAPARDVSAELVERAVVIPNAKMMAKTDSSVAASYEDFLIRAIEQLRMKGMAPFVLVHDVSGEDLRIATSLQDKLPALEVVTEPDPFAVKAIIGSASLTVGSRFHGLVNALSQGVPSLGTGWSHKYQMLFEDYNCPENLVDVRISDDELSSALDRLVKEPERGKIIAALQKGETRRVADVEKMWGDVVELVEQRGPQARRSE